MIRKQGVSKDKPQKNRGAENELRVVSSLSILKRINPLIVGHHHSQKDGENDVMGIDATIFLRNGFAFLVQIKSSNKKMDRQFTKHPNIPVIIVSEGMSCEKIAEILNELVNEFGRQFFEKIIDRNDVYPKCACTMKSSD